MLIPAALPQLGGVGAVIVAGALCLCAVRALCLRCYRFICCCCAAGERSHRESKLRKGGYGKQPMRRAPSEDDDSESTGSDSD